MQAADNPARPWPRWLRAVINGLFFDIFGIVFLTIALRHADTMRTFGLALGSLSILAGVLLHLAPLFRDIGRADEDGPGEGGWTG